MDPLKIALVLDDSLDKPDGVQQYVLTIGRWFAAQGHDVHYLVGQTARSDIPNVHSMSRNMNVRFNQNRMSMPLPVSRKGIRALLSHEQFDIIHVQMPYSPFLAGQIIRYAGPQTGVVGTFHIAPHSRLVTIANYTLRLLIGRSLRRFDEVMSVSRVAQTFAWEAFGIESEIVPNTIPLDRFYDAKPLPEYDNAFTLLFLGRLVERKGCGLFLKAVRRVRMQGLLPDNTKVIICGAGPLEQQLKEYVAKQGLHDIVQFVGRISEDDKPRYLASADIAVYPSTGGESFGIVLLEGMAAARGVVIAGNNPGYASVMGERPELLFDPFDEIQFSEKIAAYINHSEKRDELHLWQRQYVRQFNIPNVADEIRVVYDQALHKRRS